MRGYRLLLGLLMPLLAGYTAWQALRAREPRYLRERFGFYRDRPEPGGIWLHAASVGEVNAAAPLIEYLHRRLPEQPIVVSTITPTGAAVARRRLPETVRQVYLPLDYRYAVRRFLAGHRPGCALILETEIWPQLFDQCARRGLPLVIVNGRLSKRTLGAAAWIRRLYRTALTQVTAVLARSTEDAAAFEALGAPARRVQVVGNIKFAPTTAEAPPIELGRPYVLAASTHDDEELQLARAWRDAETHGCLLVIAPRHPQRLGSILKQLEPLGAKLAIRSRGEAVGAETEVYLADTFGELGGFIAGTDLVFMGGSLIPHGGHNILEVGLAGKPVVFGPHMSNFAQEARLFLDEEAAVQVPDTDALMTTVDELLRDSGRAQRMGQRGKHLLESYGGIVEEYGEAVIGHCPTLQNRARPTAGGSCETPRP